MRRGLGLGLRGWSGRVGRTERSVRRRIGYVAGSAGARPYALRAYWWDYQSNFGDQLNVDVLKHLEVAPRLSAPADADLLAIGSVLQIVDADFRGMVWGSGLLHDQPKQLPLARILALRGRLTWRNLGRPEVATFGDPGLLARRVFGAAEYDATAPVAIVPHYTQQSDPALDELRQRLGDRLWVVDVTRRPSDVIRQIATSSAVIASSLHGLVVADSYGIPASWWQQNPTPANTFKFRDYESALPLTSGRQGSIDAGMSTHDLVAMCRAVPVSSVDRIVEDLVTALKEGLASSCSRTTRLKALLTR